MNEDFEDRLAKAIFCNEMEEGEIREDQAANGKPHKEKRRYHKKQKKSMTEPEVSQGSPPQKEKQKGGRLKKGSTKSVNPENASQSDGAEDRISSFDLESFIKELGESR